MTCVSLPILLVFLSTFLKLQISCESFAAPYLLALSVGDRKFDRALLSLSALHYSVLHFRVLKQENLKMTRTERMKKETRKAQTVTRRKRRRKRTRTLCSACGATRTARPGDEAAPACP